MRLPKIRSLNDDKEKEASVYISRSQDHDSDADGGLSISSNICKLIEGKISTETNSHPSHSESEDIVYFIDVAEEKGLTRTQWKLIKMPNKLKNGAEMTLKLCSGCS